MNLRIFLEKIKTDKLWQGSLIVFVTALVVGFGNYFFQVLMGRMLAPGEFGALSALLSLSLILTVPNQTINLTVSKYVADYEARREEAAARNFLLAMAKKMLAVGGAAFLVFGAFSFLIKDFLQLDSIWPVIILAGYFIFVFLMPIGQGGQMGRQNFQSLSVGQLIQVVVKILAGAVLVYWFRNMASALVALVISSIVCLFYTFWQLRLPFVLGKTEKINFNEIFVYVRPVFFASLCLVVLYNIDVILAKHFLNATEAGYYAVLSLLGKIIFFATSSIGSVVFPVSARRHGAGLDSRRIYRLALGIVSGLSAVAVLAYGLFPELIIRILFGVKYLPVAGSLWLVALIFFFYSIINIVVLYHLSVKRTDFVPILVVGMLLEIALIMIFHANIAEILLSLASVMALILLSLGVFLRVKKAV